MDYPIQQTIDLNKDAGNAAKINIAPIFNPDNIVVQNRLPPHPTKSVAGLCDFDDWTKQSTIFYLYLPFGIIIFLVRIMVLFVSGLLIIPLSRNIKCQVLQIVLWMIGIQIKRNMNHQQIEQHTLGSVIAINHVSVFDFFLSLIQPNATVVLVHTPGNISKLMISFLMKVSGVNCWRIADKRQLAKYLIQWRKAPRKISLCVTPEATINNGRGLFSFRPEFLSRGFAVVPIAVSMKTPFGISAHPALASGPRRFLRLFMMPWIRFEMTYLQKKTQAKGQSKEAFAQEIQQDIAHQLGIPATKWTKEEKHDYISRFLFQRR